MSDQIPEAAQEAVDPSDYDPDAQGGVSYAKPKNLDAADESHPLYQRVVDRGVDEEEGIDPTSGATVPWNVPPQVLKHVSDGLYQSEEATIREFIANAETACRRVERGEANIVPDDYQPIIEITYERSKNLLVVQDNGIGIASATAVDVLRRIGVTTTRDTGSQSGQFGMGLASFLKLIGSQNSMIMKTHSRITDEDYAAYVNLGGFDPIIGGMPDGQYGTRFEMVPKSDINHEDIRSYVEKYSANLRIPVHYEEYDQSGEHAYDEDWNGSSLEDGYGADKLFTKFRKPGLLTAATSPDAEGETLLVSMPIERNDSTDHGTGTFNCPYKFDVRIEDESGAIVECRCDHDDHEGLTPVPDSEYAVMDPDQQETYIPASEVPKHDLTLPEPVTSRDTLQEHDEFWTWLSQTLAEKHEEECSETYNNFGSVEEVLNLNRRDLNLVVETLERLNYGHGTSLQEAVEERYDVTLDSDVANALKQLGTSVGLTERGENPESSMNVDWNTTVAAALREALPDGDVYMAVTMNYDKARIAWDLNENNQVVQVESEDDYDVYNDVFGWKRLKDIKLEHLHQYDVSDKLYSDLLGDKDADDVDDDMQEAVERAPPTPAEEEELNVTMAQSSYGQSRFTSKKIKKMFEQGKDLHVCEARDEKPGFRSRSNSIPDGTAVNKLILFPTNADENISDHYDLFDNYGDVQVAGANCNVRTYNYLKHLDGVLSIDGYIEDSWTAPLETQNGITSIGEARGKLIVHTVRPGYKKYFDGMWDEMPDAIVRQYNNKPGRQWEADWPDPDEAEYALLSKSDIWRYKPALKEAAGDGVVMINSAAEPEGFGLVDDRDSHNIGGAKFVFAAARLPEWDLNSNVVQEVQRISKLDKGGYEVIETLGKHHDNGGDLAG